MNVTMDFFEIILIIVGITGIPIIWYGVRWFLKSDNWLDFAKSIIISIVGLLLLSAGLLVLEFYI